MTDWANIEWNTRRQTRLKGSYKDIKTERDTKGKDTRRNLTIEELNRVYKKLKIE